MKKFTTNKKLFLNLLLISFVPFIFLVVFFWALFSSILIATVIFVLGVLPFGILGTWFYLMLKNHLVSYDNQSIIITNSLGKSTHFHWEELAEIEVNSKTQGGCLLVGKQGHKARINFLLFEEDATLKAFKQRLINRLEEYNS